MKEPSRLERLIDTPEKRIRLIRIFYFISLGMLLLGFLIIILYFLGYQWP